MVLVFSGMSTQFYRRFYRPEGKPFSLLQQGIAGFRKQRPGTLKLGYTRGRRGSIELWFRDEDAETDFKEKLNLAYSLRVDTSDDNDSWVKGLPDV